VAWALAAIVVLAGGTLLSGTGAGVVMMAAYLVFSLGECLQSAIVSPTAADLGPPRLLGRYMALVSFTWQFGLGVGAAAGGYVLQAYSPAVWVFGAAVSLVGAAGALALAPHLPPSIRHTPRTGAGMPLGPERDPQDQDRDVIPGSVGRGPERGILEL
ncbi:MAG: MFS transporter, partial [Solirubrobacteraceae bacterium]